MPKHPNAYKYLGTLEGGYPGLGFVSPGKIVLAVSADQQGVVDRAPAGTFEKFEGNITADNLALTEGQHYYAGLVSRDAPTDEEREAMMAAYPDNGYVPVVDTTPLYAPVAEAPEHEDRTVSTGRGRPPARRARREHTDAVDSTQKPEQSGESPRSDAPDPEKSEG